MGKKKSFSEYAPKTQKFILKHGMTPTEYRLKRGNELGRTIAQSRGRDKVAKVDLSPKYETAIRKVRQGSTIKSAASAMGVSETGLKKYMKEKGITTKRGSIIKQTKRGEQRVSQTVIDNDPRPRVMYTISGGKYVDVRLDYENASINGSYLNDVGKLKKGRISYADFKRKWEGVTITTIDGQVIPLETNQLALKRVTKQPSPNPYRIDN